MHDNACLYACWFFQQENFKDRNGLCSLQQKDHSAVVGRHMEQLITTEISSATIEIDPTSCIEGVKKDVGYGLSHPNVREWNVTWILEHV